MARGLPAVWSLVAALPFLVGGYLLHTISGPYPSGIGQIFAIFGGFVLLLGLYVHFIAAPNPPSFSSDEEELDRLKPTQRVATVKTIIGLPFLGTGIYLLIFTLNPYIQPILFLLLGGYLAVGGIYTYWRNSLTTYYVTDKRVIRSYRFLSSKEKEVPFNMVRGVSKNQSITEMLVGLGNVSVRTGAGSGLNVRFRNIEKPGDIADTIRLQIQSHNS